VVFGVGHRLGTRLVGNGEAGASPPQSVNHGDAVLPPVINLGQLLDAPGGRAVAAQYLTADVLAADHPFLRELLVGAYMRVTPDLRDDPSRRDAFWRDIESVLGPVLRLDPEPTPLETAAVAPIDGDKASAPWTVTGEPLRWGVIDVELRGPDSGNPFVDVDLRAEFRCGARTWDVGGFYDDAGTYRIRVLAEEHGTWEFVTTSNAAALNGVRGQFTVGPAAPQSHGPVRTDGFHFVHADGTRYRPWGTTAYAWNHQEQRMQDATLETLASSSFTKLRMCLFPKHYIYNREEPDRFAFVRDADGRFDLTRFDVEFFRHLDEQIGALGALDIQADLVLFHPYDRWGFAKLGADVDERLLRYVVRRLAAHANVWWSLANEHDLMVAKTTADWDRIGTFIAAEDPHHHLLSIHNWAQHFDNSKPWISHASVQSGQTAEETAEWRATWRKPVVVDECGYEGDLEFGWGNLSGEEMLRRIWDGAIRGAYPGHSETYWDADDRIWWSKGGRLVGSSHARIRFLDEVAAASPSGVLEPQASDFDAPWAGVPDQYLVSYASTGCPRERNVLLPPGRWRVEVLDTWECTVTPLPGAHSTIVRVPLPSKPYQAVRLIRQADSGVPPTTTAM
jgi:hypothetical protein